MSTIPRPKRLKVAADFGFRCAICRAPIWQIHHIKEVEHGGNDDYDNLIPLCQNHHLAYYHLESLIQKPELLELKKNPPYLQDCEGLFPGPLRNQRSIVLGGSILTDSHPIISYENIPIIDIRCDLSSEPHFYLYCEDEYEQPALQIEDGEWIIGKGAYRFESDINYIAILDDRHVKELIRVSLDNSSRLELTGRFFIKKNLIEISANEFIVNSVKAVAVSTKGGKGFQIMSDGRVIF